jgi:two-component system NarL family sensor kinase
MQSDPALVAFVRTRTGKATVVAIAVGLCVGVATCWDLSFSSQDAAIAAGAVVARVFLESRQIEDWTVPASSSAEPPMTTAWSMTEMVSVPLVALVPTGLAFLSISAGSLIGDRVSPTPSQNGRSIRTMLELGSAANVAVSAVVIAAPLKWALSEWTSYGAVAVISALAVACTIVINAAWVAGLAAVSGRPPALAVRPLVVAHAFPVQALVAAMMLIVYSPSTPGVLLIPLMVACLFCEGLHRLASGARSLREREDERSSLLKAALESADNQRLALASAIHDGPLQGVMAVGLRLGTVCDSLLTAPLSEVRSDLDSAGRALDKVASELRVLVHRRLATPRPDESLCGALERERAAFSISFVNGVTLECPSSIPVGDDVALLVFQVAHECLMNAVKHSCASAVDVSLVVEPDCVVVAIADDGVGSTYDDLVDGGEAHLGIRLARGRVELVGGTLDVLQTPGGGTTVRVSLPRRREGALASRSAVSGVECAVDTAR